GIAIDRRTPGSGDRRSSRGRSAGSGSLIQLAAGGCARRFVRPAAVRAAQPRGRREYMIDQKAGELGRLLGQSEEYKTLVRASDRMKEDAVVRQLLAEVERIAQDIERATQEGREPAKDQVERYDRALQSVQANPVYQQVVDAQANFEKLMTKVKARIYDGRLQDAA